MERHAVGIFRSVITYPVLRGFHCIPTYIISLGVTGSVEACGWLLLPLKEPWCPPSPCWRSKLLWLQLFTSCPLACKFDTTISNRSMNHISLKESGLHSYPLSMKDDTALIPVLQESRTHIRISGTGSPVLGPWSCILLPPLIILMVPLWLLSIPRTLSGVLVTIIPTPMVIVATVSTWVVPLPSVIV